MSSEWTNTTISECLELSNGKSRPTDGGSLNVFGSNGIIGSCQEENSSAGTIIIGRVGTYCGSLHFSDQRCWVTDNAIKALPRNGFDGRFFFHLLKTCDLARLRAGSGQPLLNQSIIGGIEVSVPPYPQQIAIAHILGTLDDKIELNRKTNETLEGIAKALFKSWFVDFDPVRAKAEGRPTGLPDEISELFPDSLEESELGEIPSGWNVKSIGDVAEVIDCLHSKKPEKLDEGSLMLQLNNIRDDGLLDVGDQFLISDSDYQKWTSRMEAREGDCVVTNVGRIGAVAQIPEGLKAALGRNMTGVRSKQTFKCHTFILEYLLSPLGREEIRINIDEGTILNALNVKSIPKLRFALPSGHLLEKYEVISRSFRKRMEMLLVENSLLCDLRDALLPRLISGELRVLDAEKILQEVGI